MFVKNKGFTLIELLVVISIIGVLSTLGMVAFKSARKRARNVARISNLEQLAKALDVYYDDNGRYLGDEDGRVYLEINCYAGAKDNLNPGEGYWSELRPYLSNLDSLCIGDPSGTSAGYLYYFSYNDQSYIVYTALEPPFNPLSKEDFGYFCDQYEIIVGDPYEGGSYPSQYKPQRKECL